MPRVVEDGVLFLSGLLETVAEKGTIALVMDTPTASTLSLLAVPPRMGTSPGIWRSAPLPLLQLIAVGPSMNGRL